MHERSFAKGLVRDIEAAARERPDCRVVAVRVRLGGRSGLKAESLRRAYLELVESTPFRRADLNIEIAPRRATCDQCGCSFLIDQQFQCKKCGSLRLTVHDSEEVFLESVMFEETGAMGTRPLTHTLQEIKFLDGFDTDHLERIANFSQMRRFEKDETLFDEGQFADNLYLIVSGSVLLEVSTAATGSKHILTVREGELLGWSSMTDYRKYAAKAVAVTPVNAVQIDGSLLKAMCDADPGFGYEFLRRTMIALARRLTTTWKQLAELYVAHYVNIPISAAAQND
jgi:Zn finger protein HypA/HybF involved in hydrogenase expression/CRP-like cAMP-binding protein